MKQHKWNHIWFMGVDAIDVFCAVFHSLACLNKFASDWYEFLPTLVGVNASHYDKIKEYGKKMSKEELRSYKELNKVLGKMLDTMEASDET